MRCLDGITDSMDMSLKIAIKSIRKKSNDGGLALLDVKRNLTNISKCIYRNDYFNLISNDKNENNSDNKKCH